MMFEILRATPIWVFVLFAYLLWMGLQRLRPGVRDIRRIGIAPAVFIAWGLVGLAGRSGPVSLTLAHWLIGAALGGALGLAMNQPLQVDRVRRLVRQPASAVPLIRNLTIFGAHYLLNVAAGLYPQSRGDIMGWDIYVSGLSAGYFIGWAIRFLREYHAAPQIDLGASPSFASPLRG
jgi:hypothetical protein